MTRKVMIGSPSYSGNIDVWYTNSLVNTIKEAITRDIEIIPIWVSFDALIQRARNDTIKIAIDMDVDDLIFIDTDIEWSPDHFFKLLDYPHDVVGGTYRKKGDKEEYVLKQLAITPPDPQYGLIEVDGLGTGFVKFSRNAINYLWDNSRSYLDPKDNQERRMVFDVIIHNQSLMSEDIYAFKVLKDGGFGIYLDPTITCNHVGPYKFQGDFYSWYSKLLPKRQL